MVTPPSLHDEQTISGHRQALAYLANFRCPSGTMGCSSESAHNRPHSQNNAGFSRKGTRSPPHPALMPRRGDRNHLRLHLLALLLLLLPQHLQARRRRRQLDIAAGKIRGLQPVGQREKLGGGQNPRRFARKCQFRRAGLRDFRIRIAQRAANPQQPIQSRRIGFELLMPGSHQAKLAELSICAMRSAVISQ